MEASLIEAVKEQIGQDEDEEYNPLADVASHGIDGGFPGFTYYTDTIAFFRANRKAIIALAKSDADEFGQDVIPFVASFGCLDDDRDTREAIGRAIYGSGGSGDDDGLVANALAWYAAESVARTLNP